VTEQPTKAPFFFIWWAYADIREKEPMTVMTHKFIGSASLRLAL